jgi:hypothetical protein
LPDRCRSDRREPHLHIGMVHGGPEGVDPRLGKAGQGCFRKDLNEEQEIWRGRFAEAGGNELLDFGIAFISEEQGAKGICFRSFDFRSGQPILNQPDSFGGPVAALLQDVNGGAAQFSI